MPPIRIRSYPISLHFIRILSCFLKALGIISCSSGISIFPRPIPFCRTVTLYLALYPGLPFLYAALLSACFEAEGIFHHGLVPHAQGNSSLCHPQWIPRSGILPVSGRFMISFPVSGRMTPITFPRKSVSPKRKPPKGKKKGEKTPCDSSSLASRLLPLLERWHLKPQNPFYLVFRLYRQQFLDRSVRKGTDQPRPSGSCR